MGMRNGEGGQRETQWGDTLERAAQILRGTLAVVLAQQQEMKQDQQIEIDLGVAEKLTVF